MIYEDGFKSLSVVPDNAGRRLDAVAECDGYCYTQEER